MLRKPWQFSKLQTSGLPEESEDKRAHTKSEQETIRHEISSLMEAMKLEMEKNYRQGFQDLSNPVWPNENPNTSNVRLLFVEDIIFSWLQPF